MAPQSSVPPALPPSVEEAYRRKCVQLKNRTNEVEDANDAARLRLARIKRQIEKLRIERAFLLEQLAKRTSTNVEDSEGSPSPPPTLADFRNGLDANPPKPKDKPLRIKRGHRKSTANDAESKAGAGSSFREGASPTSETQSNMLEGQPRSGRAAASANGVGNPFKPSASAFELYCNDIRPILEARRSDGDMNIDEELARGWDELPEVDRDEFRNKFEEQNQKQRGKDSKSADASRKKERKSGDDGKPTVQEEDVEMVNYDTEDQDAQMDKDE